MLGMHTTDAPEPAADLRPAQRYTPVAAWLHWLLGAALLAQLGFGFLLDEIAPRGTPARAPVINLHKSVGLVLAVAIAARLAWRFAHAPPPWPPSLSALEQRSARAMHALLYACMAAMPLSGYIASNFSRYGVRFFGLPLEPWGPPLPQVYAFFNGLHVGTAYVFCTLIALHVLAALKHAIVDRDAIVERMLPRVRGVGGVRAVALALLLAFLGVAGVLAMQGVARLSRQPALQVELTARPWRWEARYDARHPARAFTAGEELHLPVGQPVRLVLRSEELIHSFRVPALRIDVTLVPGRTVTLPLQIDRPGAYRGECGEFCGPQAGAMPFVLVAQPRAQYERWALGRREAAQKAAASSASAVGLASVPDRTGG